MPGPTKKPWVRFRVCGASTTGYKEKNDDHFLVGDQVSQGDPMSYLVEADKIAGSGLLAAVADGMGSYQGGALASRTVLETLLVEFKKNVKYSLDKRVRYAIKAALKQLKLVLRSADRPKAGTTLAGVALMPPDEMVIFHIGDSKVVRLQDGMLSCLTIDHTPVGKKLATGRMTVEQAVKRRDAHMLTRSLGLIGNTRSEVQKANFCQGERYLLMTDGVYSPGRGLDGATIEEFLDATEQPELLIEPMLWEATELDGDNATLVFVQIEP